MGFPSRPYYRDLARKAPWIERSADNPAGRAVAVLGGVALMSLLAFAAYRKSQPQPEASPPRDIGAVSFGDSGGDSGGNPGGNPGIGRAALTVRPRETGLPAGPADRPPLPASHGGEVFAALGDAVPTTPEEALSVLGMGVTSDASQAALKKIVDGLRMSWHPDLASHQAERQQRELRLKQINAAWDILAARRARV